jgi:hypothetical protein
LPLKCYLNQLRFINKCPKVFLQSDDQKENEKDALSKTFSKCNMNKVPS